MKTEEAQLDDQYRCFGPEILQARLIARWAALSKGIDNELRLSDDLENANKYYLLAQTFDMMTSPGGAKKITESLERTLKELERARNKRYTAANTPESAYEVNGAATGGGTMKPTTRGRSHTRGSNGGGALSSPSPLLKQLWKDNADPHSTRYGILSRDEAAAVQLAARKLEVWQWKHNT